MDDGNGKAHPEGVSAASGAGAPQATLAPSCMGLTNFRNPIAVSNCPIPRGENARHKGLSYLDDHDIQRDIGATPGRAEYREAKGEGKHPRHQGLAAATRQATVGERLRRSARVCKPEQW